MIETLALAREAAACVTIGTRWAAYCERPVEPLDLATTNLLNDLEEFTFDPPMDKLRAEVGDDLPAIIDRLVRDDVP